MLIFEDLISRTDSEWLQEQVGSMSVRVMQAFQHRGISTSELKRLFFSIVNPYDLLSDPARRNSLFDFLRTEEARDLCETLDLPTSSNPFETLNKVQIIRSSEKFDICCSFLGLPPEQKATKIDIPAYTEVDATYGLFEHQRNAVQKTIALLSQNNQRVLLHMPTGAGKTRMAMHIICDHLIANPDSVVVWLANNEELCEQAAEEFQKAWSCLGNRTTGVYRFWGQRELDFQTITDGLFIGGFSKIFALAKKSLPSLAVLGDNTSLIVVDEAHMVIAPTYELVIDTISARKINMPLLGLTATPGRTWNNRTQDEQLAKFFNKRKVSLQIAGFENPVDYLIFKKYLANPTFRNISHISEGLSPKDIRDLAVDLDVPASILRKLASDEQRTVLILKEIEDMIQRHKRLIVFATTVAHAEMLAAVLCARDHSARCVTGGTSSAQRAENIAWFKAKNDDVRIIVNFGVLTTGFDAPMTSGTLIARPTKSLVLYSQMVGRAIRGRAAGGNEEAEIVTVVDTALPGFGDLSEAFTNWEDVW